MEFKITGDQVVTVAASATVGTVIGALCHHAYTVVHTPESKIQALNEARTRYEAEKNESEAKAYEARKAYEDLASRKRAYQDEIRPAIESKIREELQTYIAQADKTYAKAQETLKTSEHNREIANLKLELAKTLSENTKETVKEKIIIKNRDDEDDYHE